VTEAPLANSADQVPKAKKELQAYLVRPVLLATRVSLGLQDHRAPLATTVYQARLEDPVNLVHPASEEVLARKEKKDWLVLLQ